MALKYTIADLLRLSGNPTITMGQDTTTKKTVSSPCYQCPTCKLNTFKSGKALREHQKVLHSQPCTRCNKNFSSAEGLAAHPPVQSTVPKPPPTPTTLPCPRCTKNFSSSHSLADHMRDKNHTKQTVKTTKQPTIVAAQDINQTATLPAPQSQSPTPDPHPANPAPNRPSSDAEEGETPIRPYNPHIPQLTESKIAPSKKYPIHNQSTTLHPLEQTLLFKYLLSKRHPIPHLKHQGYDIPDESNTTQTKPSTCLYSGTPHSTHAYPSPPPKHPQCNIRRALVLNTRAKKQDTTEVMENISVIDFLTGEILFTGSSEETPRTGDVDVDVSDNGKKWARDVLAEYMDDQTILIGHCLQADLNGLGVELGMVADRVVDIAILVGEAIYGSTLVARPGMKGWGLGGLARSMLGWDMEGMEGEGCLGPALVIREVLIWCLAEPGCLREWAEGVRVEGKGKGKEAKDLEVEGEFEDFDYVCRDDLVD
ncbi:uncharacterized protein N7511_004397 [Penicillium nucicola]|uniref:uncharacterized protein n=1 Tax=Penicillium nucicola TaxID=1850975 RepID=UPI0025455850|nr:uncharacterized protein N7511_004397 [Penicillium nucicola]KAJ5766781.1 hypothetical protein N7511_004397 [Penicillium nucicola]